MSSSSDCLLRLSERTPQPVRWLWPGRLAEGALALLDGDPGEGKSLITLDVAARLSTGRPLPDALDPAEPCSVVLLASEDSLDHVLLPRLRAAGADLARIHVFRPRSAAGRDRLPVLPDDADLLRRAVAEANARLVIIDPFLSFLAARCAALNDQLVRHALDPLTDLAEQTRAAILIVRHLTKGGRSRRALLRGAGAVAIIGAARTAFLAGRHPDEPEVRLLAANKNNYGSPSPTLAYVVRADAAGQPVIDWQGPVPQTADDLARGTTPAEPGDALREATEFLDNVLAAGPASRETVLRQANAAGLAERTLRRAKIALHIRSEERRIDGHNVWFWSLPPDDDSERLLRDLYREDAELRRQRPDTNVS